jgi:CRP-like cAMP-binding protein
MAPYFPPPDLHDALQKHCEKVKRRRLTVLFRRGQAPFGMFLVIAGAVRLDFGVDVSNALNNIYGPGALVGLPATITGRNYSMTATVTDDAELGFLSCQTVKSLLREQPEICQQLLKVLSAKIANTDRVILRKRGVPETELGVA